MARCIFSVLTLLIFVFNVSTTVTAFEKNITTKNSTSLYKVGTSNKYNIKVKVSAKDKTSLMSFNSSDLRWPNVSTKSALKNSAWALKGDNYIWEPRDKSQFIKIPLRQKFTTNKSSPELVNEIQIEYQNLFPNNPVSPLVKIVIADKKSLTKKVLHFKQNRLGGELLKVSSASWIKKDNLYLFRRTLGINLKPSWRYSQDRHYTVLQRQFDKNIHLFDTIDLILDKELNENQMKEIVSNFRISGLNSGTKKIIPHIDLDPVFIKALDKRRSFPLVRSRLADRR